MNEKVSHEKARHNVVMIGCFDTKAEDFEYLYSCLVHKGVRVIAINTGILGRTDRFIIDLEAEQVSRAVEVDLMELRQKNDRGTALDIMGKGAAKIVSQLVKEGKVDGIISMGGGGGTFVALMVMQEVPFGIPKVCLTTLASKDLSEKVGDKDIVLIPSIVDVGGLNRVSRLLISQAAGALCGMMEMPIQQNKEFKGSIAMSAFGNTSVSAATCSELLKADGYDVLSFHAVGSGGKTMESLVDEGLIDAVLDLTITELADELCGGICSAGPDRMTAAAIKGVPQVIVPGCLDMVNFGNLDSVPEKYKNRQLFSWAPDVTLMRTNEEENRILGRQIAEKINISQGPVTILLPLGGLSKLGGEGEIFYNPEIDKVLFDSIRQNVKDTLCIRGIDANINTQTFAKQAVKSLLNLMKN